LAPPPALLPARPIPQIQAMPQPLAALPPPRPMAIRQPIQPPQLLNQPLSPQAVRQLPAPVRHAPRQDHGQGQVQVRQRFNLHRVWEEFFREIEDEGNDINTNFEIVFSC